MFFSSNSVSKYFPIPNYVIHVSYWTLQILELYRGCWKRLACWVVKHMQRNTNIVSFVLKSKITRVWVSTYARFWITNHPNSVQLVLDFNFALENCYISRNHICNIHTKIKGWNAGIEQRHYSYNELEVVGCLKSKILFDRNI